MHSESFRLAAIAGAHTFNTAKDPSILTNVADRNRTCDWYKAFFHDQTPKNTCMLPCYYWSENSDNFIFKGLISILGTLFFRQNYKRRKMNLCAAER